MESGALIEESKGDNDEIQIEIEDTVAKMSIDDTEDILCEYGNEVEENYSEDYEEDI